MKTFFSLIGALFCAILCSSCQVSVYSSNGGGNGCGGGGHYSQSRYDEGGMMSEFVLLRTTTTTTSGQYTCGSAKCAPSRGSVMTRGRHQPAVRVSDCEPQRVMVNQGYPSSHGRGYYNQGYNPGHNQGYQNLNPERTYWRDD